MNPELSIIIPAYNEEPRIVKSLGSAFDYLTKKQISFEIIVVDDGSSDRTVEVAGSFSNHVKVISQPKNMGKGAAVRRGMLESNGKIRIFTDADFSTPIYEIEKIIEKINNGADICIGSRAIDYSMIKVHQPAYREMMGKFFNKIVQFLLFKGIKDTQCGFKGFTADAATAVFSKSKIDGFSFDVEILFLANSVGFKIEQVPVEWYNDERTRVTTMNSLKAVLELFRIKKLHS